MSLNPDELTERIEQAFQRAWLKERGQPVSGPPDDRRILFAAVAGGVLGYLKEKENELLATLTVRDDGEEDRLDVTEAELGIEGTQ